MEGRTKKSQKLKEWLETLPFILFIFGAMFLAGLWEVI